MFGYKFNVGNKIMAVVLVCTFFGAFIPLTQSSQQAPVTPSAFFTPKNLTRTDPVVILGSNIPGFVSAAYNVSNIFVWAYQSDGWRQVVFQIDEANGTFLRKDTGTSSGPQKNFYIADNWLMDADDELVFMANETGNQIHQNAWPPGADMNKSRYEITVTDPLTGQKGWVYLFYHTTPPTWTTVDYVSWTESTNFLDAYGYSIDYNDADNKQLAYLAMNVKPSIGGDNVDLVDRDKRCVNVAVTIEPIRVEISASTRGLETYYSGLDNDLQYYHEYAIKDGPVRVIKHLRWGFGSANLFDMTDKMGWRSFNEYKYYSNMYVENEYLKVWTTSAKSQYYYRAVDHSVSAGSMAYYNGNGSTGTVNGNPADDNVLTNVMTWDQVSSAHGSYVTRYDIGAFSGEGAAPITKTTRWIDNSGSADTDGSSPRTGAEAGRYGEHGLYFDNPNAVNTWGEGQSYYTTYFMGANSPNVGSTYNNYSASPLTVTTPVPLLQVWKDDVWSPATMPGTVLVNGQSTYTVNVSSLGNVLLTATVDDTGQGGHNVTSAVWTRGFAAFPGVAMTAVDGAFNDEVAEDVQATVNLANWAAGTYLMHVYGTDDRANQNTTSTEHATIIIVDNMAPSTQNATVKVNNATTYTTNFSVAVPVNLTATVSDVGRGNSTIISSVWTTGFANFPGTAMSAADSLFNNYTENVTYTLPLNTWNAGTYLLYVYGTDATPLQNTTSTEHATVTIVDDVAPRINNVLLNGVQTYTMSMWDNPFLNLTATVNDSATGGTIIGGANYTIGAQAWATSKNMTNVTPLDTSVEDFGNQLNVTGWEPGTYLFYVYGRDTKPNYNSTSQAFATLIITNDQAPEIKNVLVNGQPSVSIPFSARSTVSLTATLDDTGHGDNIIAGANYTIGQVRWPGINMSPDTPLDGSVEDFSATVDLSGWAVGTYDLYVYGWDESNDFNSSSTEYARVIIYDDVAPQIENVTINGSALFETTNSVARTISFKARVNDTLCGNSIIVGANYTVGPANWPGQAMTPDTALDTPRETFTTIVNITGWASGIYYFYAYGWDNVPNYNSTSSAYATLVIHDVLAPMIQNVLINGTSTFNVNFADAKTIKLTATVNDTGKGDSEIGGANFTRGFVNWPTSSPMLAENETALADVPVAGIVSSDDYTAPNNYKNTMQTPDDDRYEYIQEATTSGMATYDFKTYGSGDKQAYSKNFASGTFTATNFDMMTGGAWGELAPAAYSNINTEDALDYSYSSANAKCWRYHIHVNQAEAGVTRIDSYWTSDLVARIACCPVTLNVWDSVGLTWVQIASGSTTGNDQPLTLTGSVTTNLANYIDASGNVYIGIFSPDPGATARDVQTDYINITVSYTGPCIDHRWRWNMGSNPTFYIEGSNPAGSDSTFALQWSNDNATWNDFSSQIRFAPGELNVLKSSPIALGAYDSTFYLRAITSNWTGMNIETFSVDRMWTDGGFNKNPENVYAFVDISAWTPGTYRLYVYGWDKTPQYNATSTAYATLIIDDNRPPEIFNFLANGAKTTSVSLSSRFVTLTGLVDDTNTGGSNIKGAAYTIGYQNWNTSANMTNDTPLDSPVETFSELVNVSTWHHGANVLFMYGGDVTGMVNDTSTENATVNVIDDLPPITRNWSAMLNGANELWIDPVNTSTVSLNATISDELFGYSNISAANWTVGLQNWTNSWMLPADGSWNNFSENVTTSIDLTGWSMGIYYIYVYGTDEFGNGQTVVLTYATLHVDRLGPAISTPLADNLNPYIWETDTSFLLTAYGDDRARGGSDVLAAEYFVDTIGVNGTGIAMSPIGFRFDSPYEGAKATVSLSGWAVGDCHTYYVHFKDALGHWGDWGSVLVLRKMQFAVPIHLGWNLISVPLVTPNTNLTSVLSDIAGQWDYVMTYQSPSGQWLSNLTYRSGSQNMLATVNNKMAIWVHVTSVGDGYLNITGAKPGISSIQLYAGWNFVGYPTLNATKTITDALMGTNYDKVEGYSASDPYLLQELPGTYIMTPGEGYWVHVPSDTTWVINW